MTATLIAALIAAFVAMPAAAQRATGAADESSRHNLVELQAEAQREVANDLLTATLYAELNDMDAARLAAALNTRTNEGLAAAKEYRTVRARSGGNQTYPVYDRNQRLTGWRGRAEIRIESRDFQAAGALIGKLQSGMQLGGINFGVSPEARQKAQDELIAEAIAAFRARGEIVKTALGGRGYKIRRMAVNTGGGSPQPRPVFAARAMSAEAVPAPQLEGGVSQITVNVSGAIEVE